MPSEPSFGQEGIQSWRRSCAEDPNNYFKSAISMTCELFACRLLPLFGCHLICIVSSSCRRHWIDIEFVRLCSQSIWCTHTRYVPVPYWPIFSDEIFWTVHNSRVVVVCLAQAAHLACSLCNANSISEQYNHFVAWALHPSWAQGLKPKHILEKKKKKEKKRERELSFFLPCPRSFHILIFRTWEALNLTP